MGNEAENTVSAGQQLANVSQSIQNSLSDLANQAILVAPKIIIALLVLVFGFVLARILARTVSKVCERFGLQRAAERSGLVDSMKHVGISRTVPQIVGVFAFWLLLFASLMVAFDILALPGVARAMESVVAYIPNLLVATIVVVLGLLLASFVKGVVATGADQAGLTYAPQLATACYWILALITGIAAFDQLQIQFKLLNEAILIAFAAVGVAFGLSFCLGVREVMGGILAGYYLRQRLQSGDHVSVAGLEGTVHEVGPVATVIETEEDGLTHRHTVPNTKMLNEAVR
jgi:hypothetical protein